MGISSALNNAVSGLSANARMAEVVSSNLANVLTDGYGRRSVTLSSVQVGRVGAGVRVDAVNRFVDAGLLSDRRLADAALAGQDQSVAMLLRLEHALGTPDDPTNIGNRLAALDSALISASSDPASETRLATVASRLQDVTKTLQTNTHTIQSLRQEADSMIARDIDALNSGLRQVDAHNEDITRARSRGQDPSALLDARQRAVDQIARVLPIREMPRENGTIGLMTTNGTTLLDANPVQFGFLPTPTITADMTMASGALSGITLDGAPIDPIAGLGRLGGGTLGAAFEMRDNTLVESQAGLDAIAVDLIARYQDPANDPSIIPGNIGLLTDEGGILDLADVQGLAGRIAVNTAIVPRAGGDLQLLRDGLYAPTPLSTGDPTQLNRWKAALETPRADLPGEPTRSALARASAFTSEIGGARLSAEESLSFTSARWSTLREAELLQGVDSDRELQTLLQIEQAYAANARVIETVELLMQRLLEI